MAPVKPLVLAALALGSDAMQLREKKWSGCGPLPVYMRKTSRFLPEHKNDRQVSHHKKHFSLAQEDKFPGVGVDPAVIYPYEESYKDGWAHTACVLDTMLVSGDKFGNGKFNYKLGETHNVSIVNYDDWIPKEDREKITHKVCFEFCRTIKDMLFFGVTNGRGCYCAPYFEQEAGDSSECDKPCDGNTELMCGGKSKSDIFEMHTCGKADENLDTARETLTKDLEDFASINSDVETAAESMQAAAEKLQPAFGTVGDGASSDLCHKAKQFAGTLEKAAKDGNKLLTEASDLLGAGDKPEGDRAKEQLTDKMQNYIDETKPLSKEVSDLAAKGIAPAQIKGAPGDLYKPVMYFVDKEFEEVPSTCGGDLAADPLIGTFAGCAVACEMQVGKCVGFQFMPTGEEAKTSAYAYEYEYSYTYYFMLDQEDAEEEVAAEPEGLCFLFEKVETAFYYTGCDSGKSSSFLQKMQAKKEATDTKCVLKGAKFFGLDLTPNPSGKCDLCLKKATKADRCFE